MTDSATRQPIRVSTDGTAGPYIMVSVELLEKVRELLVENDVPHWVDHLAISVDRRPAVTVINLGRKTDPRRVQELLDATRQSLDAGIAECRSGRRLSDVSHAIQRHVEKHGFSVVRAFVGHGIGRALHEEPQVPNFGDPGRGPQLKPGMVLAIEPMVTMGSWEVRILDDGWTAVTKDGSLAAHFEHTIAVTESGPEVLTSKSGGPARAA